MELKQTKYSTCKKGYNISIWYDLITEKGTMTCHTYNGNLAWIKDGKIVLRNPELRDQVKELLKGIK